MDERQPTGELRDRLEALAEEEFPAPDHRTRQELIPLMLAQLGNSDPHLRDELIYTAFAVWIWKRGALTPEELAEILNTVLDERHLFYRLGEADSDSVFTRSFSALLLALILFSDREQRAFLSNTRILKIKAELLHYLAEERDRRGYVEGKGWAHAVAHTADALDELVQHPALGAEALLAVLGAVRDVFCEADSVYTLGEEERMATVVLAVKERELVQKEVWRRWLQGFTEAVTAVDGLPEALRIRSNVKNFLQSLYFRLRWQQQAADQFLLQAIEEQLQAISRYA